MYPDASCVRVSMLAFECVHARVREGVCVSPSVCLSVRVHVSASICLSYMSAFINACVRVLACVREGVCLNPSVRPSVSQSACMSVCLSACMFVRPNVCSHMRAFINAYAIFFISNFLLLTSYF